MLSNCCAYIKSTDLTKASLPTLHEEGQDLALSRVLPGAILDLSLGLQPYRGEPRLQICSHAYSTPLSYRRFEPSSRGDKHARILVPTCQSFSHCSVWYPPLVVKMAPSRAVKSEGCQLDINDHNTGSRLSLSKHLASSIQKAVSQVLGVHRTTDFSDPGAT